MHTLTAYTLVDGLVGGSPEVMVVGALAAVAVAVARVARRWLPVSEVVAFLVIGMVLGPRVANVIGRHAISDMQPVTAVALGAMVFLVAEQLRVENVRRFARTLVPMSLVGSALAFAVSLAAMVALHVPLTEAYLLAAIAPSTAPVTIRALINEQSAQGRFTEQLQAATALNCLATALLYGFGAPLVFGHLAAEHAQRQATMAFLQLVVASIVIGLLGGVALRVLRRFDPRPGDRFLMVWIVLLLVVGAAQVTHTSVVITALITGVVAANSPTPATDMFDGVRILEPPIFLIFFIVTGADVRVHEFLSLGIVGAGYVAARTAGRVLGSWLGLATRHGRALGWGYRAGLAQLPFAGMAVGLASYSVARASSAGAPHIGTQVAAIVLGTVLIFELLTPILLERVLRSVGEAAPSQEPARVEP